MSILHSFDAGGYAFLQGGFPYSAGVIALPGFAIVRTRLPRVLPVDQGFALIESHLRASGRPLTALCAAELRSPTPFSFDGFHSFNQGYVEVLTRWGIVRDGLNPVARSNVCPQFDPPQSPGFHAFCFTVSLEQAAAMAGADALSWGFSKTAQQRDFVIAGSGEWPEDQPFPQGIVARGDLSPNGLARKAAYVLDTMRARVEGVGGQWQSLSAAQVYTVHDIHPLLGSHFAANGLTAAGLDWHPCRPPILELEFEMDLRSVRLERVLPSL
ncbi:MAG: hypothetical protein VW257_00590 [Quisquiliibacterium sp.]